MQFISDYFKISAETLRCSMIKTRKLLRFFSSSDFIIFYGCLIWAIHKQWLRNEVTPPPPGNVPQILPPF